MSKVQCPPKKIECRFPNVRIGPATTLDFGHWTLDSCAALRVKVSSIEEKKNAGAGPGQGRYEYLTEIDREYNAGSRQDRHSCLS